MKIKPQPVITSAGFALTDAALLPSFQSSWAVRLSCPKSLLPETVGLAVPQITSVSQPGHLGLWQGLDGSPCCWGCCKPSCGKGDQEIWSTSRTVPLSAKCLLSPALWRCCSWSWWGTIHGFCTHRFTWLQLQWTTCSLSLFPFHGMGKGIRKR